MAAKDLDSVRECCTNQKSFLIIYNGAVTADLPILVCTECVNNSIFQQFVVIKFEINKKTDIDQILKNYLS